MKRIMRSLLFYKYSVICIFMKKLFFKKGYIGSEKDTIIQETSILVLVATIVPWFILHITMKYIFNYYVALFSILFIVLANVSGIVYLYSIKSKIMRGAKDTYLTCNYYRDVPNNGYIDVTFTLLYYFHINKWDRTNVIGALIIKFLNDGIFELIVSKRDFIDNYEFKIVKEPTDDVEKRFYSIIVGAAGYDNVLQVGELKSYLKRNTESIDCYYKYLIDCGKQKLSKINAYSKEPYYIFDNLSEQGINQISEVYGLEKFFDDFTLLDEREIKESVIWESYFVYSTLIGNADNVLKRFKEFYSNDLKCQYEELMELYQNKTLGLYEIFVYVGNRILN